MDPVKRAYLELHIAVFLFGFTAILGDLISLSAAVLVWWRVLMTSISLLFIIRVRHLIAAMPRRQILQFMGIGVIVALHWITFYGSVKLANASIALVCMATSSFFTSLIEPIVMRYKVRWYELALGLLIIPGMVLVAQSTVAGMMAGVWVGLVSAFLASIFAIFNKKLIHLTNPLNITFLELGSAWLFLSLILPVYFYFEASAVLMPTVLDWLYLIILSLLCTTLAYVLALRSLKYLTAFASNLTVNLEPVYGIALAWVLLDDHTELSGKFYLGVFIILAAVFSYPLLRKKYGHRYES